MAEEVKLRITIEDNGTKQVKDVTVSAEDLKNAVREVHQEVDKLDPAIFVVEDHACTGEEYAYNFVYLSSVSVSGKCLCDFYLFLGIALLSYNPYLCTA